MNNTIRNSINENGFQTAQGRGKSLSSSFFLLSSLSIDERRVSAQQRQK